MQRFTETTLWMYNLPSFPVLCSYQRTCCNPSGATLGDFCRLTKQWCVFSMSGCIPDQSPKSQGAFLCFYVCVCTCTHIRNWNLSFALQEEERLKFSVQYCGFWCWNLNTAAGAFIIYYLCYILCDFLVSGYKYLHTSILISPEFVIV